MTAAATAKSKAASMAQPGAISRASGPLLNAIRLASGLPTWTNPPATGQDRAKVIAALLPTMTELRSAERELAQAVDGPPAEPVEVVASVRWLVDAYPVSTANPTAAMMEALLREAADEGLTGTVLAAAVMRVAREAKLTPAPAHVVAAAAAIRAQVETAHACICGAIRTRQRAEALLTAALNKSGSL